MSDMTETRKAQMRALEQAVTDAENAVTKYTASGLVDTYGIMRVKLAEVEFRDAARSFVPDALAHIETLEEAARDHDCPSFAMCTRHATKEGANPECCVYCEIERLVEVESELSDRCSERGFEIRTLQAQLMPAFDSPCPDGTMLCGVCDQTEARGHAPDCPGPNWPHRDIADLKAQLAARDAEVAQLADELAEEQRAHAYEIRQHVEARVYRKVKAAVAELKASYERSAEDTYAARLRQVRLLVTDRQRAERRADATEAALATLRRKVISLNYLVRDLAEATSTGDFFKGGQWAAGKIAEKMDALGLTDTEATK